MLTLYELRCATCGRSYTTRQRSNHGRPRQFCGRACAVAWRYQPAVEVLREKVDRMPSGCWEWTGVRDNHGYGKIIRDHQVLKVHRVAWESVNGPIPYGMHVRHHCDNPPCVNPDHLAIGTHADNMRDMADRGRAVPTGARLSEAEVIAVRQMVAGGLSQAKAAAAVGVSPSDVSRIMSRQVWRHVGS